RVSSLNEIDPSTNQVVKSLKLRGFISSVAVGGGYVWATVVPDDTLWKVQQDGTIDRTLSVGHAPRAVTWFGGAAWVAARGVLQRVDPASDVIKDFAIIDRPQSLGAGVGSLFVSTGRSPPPLAPVAADRVVRVSVA